MHAVLKSLAPVSALALTVVVFVPTPAAAVPILPLDPVIELPEDPGMTGNTTPAVALRPDGGMVTVWVELPDDRVVGRWFGPTYDPSSPESGHFVLSEEGAASGGVTVARGAGGGYLAVWQGATSDLALSARAFGGNGAPLSETRLVAESSVVPPALAARPDGGFVLAWWQEAGGTRSLRYRYLAEDGTPLGSIEVVPEPASGVATSARVAVGPDGGFTVSWGVYFPAEETSGVWAKSYSPVGAALGPVTELVVVEDGSYHLVHDLAAVGPGELLAIWAEQPAGGEQAIRARHFHPDGSVAPVRRVDVPGEEPYRVSMPGLAGSPDGEAVAVWYEALPESSVRARLLAADATSRSGAFTVASGNDTGEYVNGTDADRDSAGRLALAWGIGVDTGFIPTGGDMFRDGFARRFREGVENCEPLLTIDFRTEPVAPTEDDEVRLVFEGLADCAQLSLGSWSLEPDGFHVQPIVEPGICGTFPPFPYTVPVDVGALPAGDYPVSFEVPRPDDEVCVRSFGFHVEEGEPSTPPHPDAPPLTSDELPGFRTWVVITAGGDPVLGASEPACISETLCVSGRVPGRSEVFVRVVGPKPNGRLWPTLVKFTTSTAEVWIEQVSTGEVEYYRLEGASPGVDELPGLFDRAGFPP